MVSVDSALKKRPFSLRPANWVYASRGDFSRAVALSLMLMVVAAIAGVGFLASSAQAQGVALDAVRVNEAQSSNASTLQDASGSTPDWIEIFNPGDTTVDLAGWSLSDSQDPGEWLFPAGTLIGPSEYLIVFASGEPSTAGELHADFKLSSSGDWVGIYDPVGVFQTSLTIPALPADWSWGIGLAGGERVFENATPGSENGVGTIGLVDPVAAFPERGFYTSPLSVSLTSVAGDTIMYTLDGTEPSAGHGTVYTGPIPVSATAVLRAVPTRPGWSSPRPTTHTYIFADDVPDQPLMQPLPVGVSRSAIVASINELPVISLTSTTTDNQPRLTWSTEDDAAVAVEMIHPDGTTGFHIDAGAHEVGGHSLRYEKDSLRLVFGSEWGESKLDYPVFAGADNPASPAATEFKRLTLRMGAHDTGFFWNTGYPAADPYRSYMRSPWHDDIMLDLGHVGTHNRYVNVFLNGEYWGFYQLREHFDDHFAASYFGGDNEEYVGINRGVPASGDDFSSAWDAVSGATGDWQTFTQYVDPVNYVDFMLITEYGANLWDLTEAHNWRATGPRDANGAGGSKFVFTHSDTDISLVSLTADIDDASDRVGTTPANPGPLRSWQDLRAEAHPEFLALVAERAEYLLIDGGPLSEAANRQRWSEMAAPIQNAIHAEHARWNVYTPSQWADSVDWLTNTLSSQRPNRLAAILQDKDLLFAEAHLGQAGTAQQSSTWPGGDASKAVDGDVDGHWYEAGSTTATQNEYQPWWEVDLGSVRDLDLVRIWNRYDLSPERLNNFHVFVSDTPFSSNDVDAIVAQPGVTSHYFSGAAGLIESFPIDRTGRFVRVQLGGDGLLQMGEVQVFGRPLGAPGDVDCNGILNVLDAVAIAQFVVGLREGTDSCQDARPNNEVVVAAADTNGDGLINVLDAVTVSQCVAGLSNTLCP